MKVYQAINAISAELSKDGIGKNRKNAQQGYNFRGIDEVLNALAPLLSANKLTILPEVLERDCVERLSSGNKPMFYVTVKVRFSFVSSEDGSAHAVVTYGEAMDMADKATNKAMSAAYKYAAIMTFCIPTEGDNDADAVTHDIAPSTPQSQPFDWTAWLQAYGASIDKSELATDLEFLVKSREAKTAEFATASPVNHKRLIAKIEAKRASFNDASPLPQAVE